MKNYLLIIGLACTLLNSYGQTINKSAQSVKGKPGDTFWHHSGELSIAPNAGYFIYAQGKAYTDPNAYKYQLPFIGYNLSGQYMYRPVEIFAISAGLGFNIQGNFTRVTNLWEGKKYVSEREVNYTGYLNIPVQVNLFKKMRKCTFGFAIGPQFSFPAIWRYHSIPFKPDGNSTFNSLTSGRYTVDEMRLYSSLGCNILLGAEFELARHVNLFIGPQINFINLVFFGKNRQQQRTRFGDRFDCSLGFKMGFRFH